MRSIRNASLAAACAFALAPPVTARPDSDAAGRLLDACFAAEVSTDACVCVLGELIVSLQGSLLLPVLAGSLPPPPAPGTTASAAPLSRALVACGAPLAFAPPSER